MFCWPAFDYFKQQLPNNEFNYLEIGIFNGDSIAELARANTNKIIYGIDPFIEDGCTMHTTHVKENESMPTQRQNTYNNIAGLNNIKLFEMKSVDFYNQLTDEMVKEMNIGWILVDGSHHYEDVVVDIKLAFRLIGNKKGAIIFDDTHCLSVRKAYDEFLITYKDQIISQIDINYNENKESIRAHFIRGLKDV